MMKVVKFLLFVIMGGIISGCKIAVIVVEGGEVQTIGSGTCLEGTTCVYQVDDPYFSETFTAVPSSDWEFVKWYSADGFLCHDSTGPVCIVSGEAITSAIESNIEPGSDISSEAEAFVASDVMFYIMPVFRPNRPITDTVTVDGKEWAQADLFLYLSWDQINAVCPAGVCGDTGTLNGYDMTGWTWASVNDVKVLFNGYIGDQGLDPETGQYEDVTGHASERFYADGWRPTKEGPVKDFLGTTWAAHLRDTTLQENGNQVTGEANHALLRTRDDIPEFVMASFGVGSRLGVEASSGRGAAFHR